MPNPVHMQFLNYLQKCILKMLIFILCILKTIYLVTIQQNCECLKHLHCMQLLNDGTYLYACVLNKVLTIMPCLSGMGIKKMYHMFLFLLFWSIWDKVHVVLCSVLQGAS